MKKIAFYCAFAPVFFAACKKESVPDTPVEPTATLTSIVSAYSAATPSQKIPLYTIEVVTNTEMPISIANTFQSDFDPSKLKDLEIVYHFSATDSVVKTHPYFMDGTWPLQVFPKGKTTVKLRATAPALFFGTVTTYVQVFDQYNNGLTPNTLCQKTVFGYGDALVVETLPVPTDPILDGVERELVIFKFTTPSGKRMATKGAPAVRTTFIDNGISSGLQFGSLKVYLEDEFGTRNITDSVDVVDSLGNLMFGISEAIAAHKKFQVVYKAGYGAIEFTDWAKITISGTPEGFGPSTDPDLFKAEPIQDLTLPPTTHTHLNKGTAYGNWIKTYSSATANSDANRYRQNFAWKVCEPGVQTIGNYGVSSSGWRNGYKLNMAIQPTILHTRVTLKRYS